jgi:hypothetical protein
VSRACRAAVFEVSGEIAGVLKSERTVWDECWDVRVLLEEHVLVVGLSVRMLVGTSLVLIVYIRFLLRLSELIEMSIVSCKSIVKSHN